MYTLFISTFNEYVIISLLKDDKIISYEEQKSNHGHSLIAVPTIEKILEKENITPQDLNQIEVINGPGSFTGVRIGVTIAKTLAYTLNIPIKTISTLQAYAVSQETNNKKILTLSDIKGTYFGLFSKDNELLEPLNYLNKAEFTNYLEKNNLHNYLIENPKLDIVKIHKFLKTKESTNPHNVNPLYIKKIEVEK